MRNQWRLFLFRTGCRSVFHSSYISSHSQVHSTSIPSLSSFLCARSSRCFSARNEKPVCLNHDLRSSVDFRGCCVSPRDLTTTRGFSSEPVVEEKESEHAVVIEILNRLSDKDEIKKELDSNGIVISHELGLKVLKGLESKPDVARKFFYWVLETDAERLSSKSYNYMLGSLGVYGSVDEFWGMVDTMKKKGYGISARTRDRVAERFKEEGLKTDLERLSGLFATGSMDNSVEKVSARIRKIVRKEDWSSDVEKKIKDLKVDMSSDLVKLVMENLDVDPRKALLFFRWIAECGLCKHDEQNYNSMARVLGRGLFLDRFWIVLDEMRSAGHELELETFVRVSRRFMQSKMIKEAVELYEFAMAGANTPTPQFCTFLLQRIAVAKELDVGLATRVVKAYTRNGNMLKDSTVKSVLKSLISAARTDECSEMLKSMKDGGGVDASGDMMSEVALRLGHAGKKEQVNELENLFKADGNNLDDRALASFVEAHCAAGNLEKASECFKKMTAKEGDTYIGYAFEKLVLAHCNRNRAGDAYKLLHEYRWENGLKPWHSTYKALVRNLLKEGNASEGGLADALDVLRLMKSHGFPPFLDPFVDHVAKSGSSEDGFAFLKGMTSKKFPSLTVVRRVFEALLKESKVSQAQDLLSKCPGYVRRHPDVLGLFASRKSNEATPTEAVAV